VQPCVFLCLGVRSYSLYDNTGRFDEWMNEGTKADVCRAFPRNGWSETFACTVESEMR
jgi:hypothetical protein